jgi:hypothetical protein
MSTLTQKRLKEVLNYDPETGEFTWLVSAGRRVRVGDVAGYQRPDGYCRIQIDGRNYRAHRLAWLHMTGEWPPHQIDHINGDPSDNRTSNLRPATHSQNMANSRKPRHNTSGFKGVSWQAAQRKWVASLKVNGRTRFLGRFDCPAAAHAAYVAAAVKHSGEFARVA